MNADCLSVGLQRVDANFCRGVFGSAGVVATPGAVTVSFPKGKTKSVAYEWGVLVRQDPLLIAKAKAEIPTAAISSFQLESAERSRTRVRLIVEGQLALTCGMQSWDSLKGRRCKPSWSSDGLSAGNAALPPLLRNELMRTKTHEVVLMHTLEKVKKEFKEAGLVQGKKKARPVKGSVPQQEEPTVSIVAPPAVPETPRTSRKRPLEASTCKTRKPRTADLEVPEGLPEAKEEDGREMGSNGEQCDWCGMTPGEGEAALKVCGRCHYTCCAECSPHPTKGTCHCKDSNFGEPYPRGAARRRHMTGSW